MLSGFFDDIQDEDSNKSKKKQNIREYKSAPKKSNTPKSDDYKYKSSDKDYSRPPRSNPKYQEDFKTSLKKHTIPKKYPSPPRPPLPKLKPIKNVKKYDKNENKDYFDNMSNKENSLQFSEGNIMDNLLVYQKKLIDKVSNFRTESIKQIDLMIGEIDKINYSKYSKKRK